MLSHPFPSRDDPRRRSADSQSLPLSPALGGRVLRLGTCLVWVLDEEERSQCPKLSIDTGRSQRQLGPRYSVYQHPVPEKPSYVSWLAVFSTRHSDSPLMPDWYMTVVGVYTQTGSNTNSSNSKLVSHHYFGLLDWRFRQQSVLVDISASWRQIMAA